MRYSEQIKKENQAYYSLNFLLAEFDEMKNRKENTQSAPKQITSDFFQTKDFRAIPYYKNISTIIKLCE
jgi:hypothetical protein